MRAGERAGLGVGWSEPELRAAQERFPRGSLNRASRRVASRSRARAGREGGGGRVDSDSEIDIDSDIDIHRGVAGPCEREARGGRSRTTTRWRRKSPRPKPRPSSSARDRRPARRPGGQHGERLVPHLQPAGEDDVQRQGLQVYGYK